MSDQPRPSSYAEALDELEALLDELEGTDVDVDLLSQRVARGVDLIRFCRSRLEVVTDDVDGVVAELVALTDPETPSSTPTDPDLGTAASGAREPGGSPVGDEAVG